MNALLLASLLLLQAKKEILPGEGIDWKGDWNAAVKEATARNVPILFSIFKDGDATCNTMISSVFTDPNVISLSRSFVNIVGVDGNSHGDKEVGKDKTRVCKRFHVMPCDYHVKTFRYAFKFYQSPIMCPATVFCDPQGNLLFKADGAMSPGDLVKKMQSALGKISGEKITLPLWKKAHGLLDDGRAALEKGEIKKALEAFRKVAAMKGRSLQTMAADAIAKVAEVGEQRLVDALALADLKERKRALAKIVEEFKGFDVAAKAKKELD